MRLSLVALVAALATCASAQRAFKHTAGDQANMEARRKIMEKEAVNKARKMDAKRSSQSRAAEAKDKLARMREDRERLARAKRDDKAATLKTLEQRKRQKQIRKNRSKRRRPDL